jgi:heme oxygenase
MTQEMLTAPEGTEAIEGEVIEPAALLKEHEQNIRKNFKKFEAVQQSVARSLNVIYHNDLWKLHKTAEGKRRYTNFNDYLATEFGWDKTAARARQIMKADIPAAIEAGEIPAEVGDKRRDRSAPEISAVKAAKVTAKQLQSVIDAWNKRMDNVESGDAYGALVEIHVSANEALVHILADLDSFVKTQDAEWSNGNDDESDEDESQDEQD